MLADSVAAADVALLSMLTERGVSDRLLPEHEASAVSGAKATPTNRTEFSLDAMLSPIGGLPLK